MTETIQAENASVMSPETKSPFHERIVERKTIVYETLVNPAVMRIAVENLKEQLFTKYSFLAPKLNEISLVSLEKSYEPFIITTGAHSVDYHRKDTVAFRVDAVSKVVFSRAGFSSKEMKPFYHERRN